MDLVLYSLSHFQNEENDKTKVYGRKKKCTYFSVLNYKIKNEM